MIPMFQPQLMIWSTVAENESAEYLLWTPIGTIILNTSTNQYNFFYEAKESDQTVWPGGLIS